MVTPLPLEAVKGAAKSAEIVVWTYTALGGSLLPQPDVFGNILGISSLQIRLP